VFGPASYTKTIQMLYNTNLTTLFSTKCAQTVTIQKQQSNQWDPFVGYVQIIDTSLYEIDCTINNTIFP